MNDVKGLKATFETSELPAQSVRWLSASSPSLAAHPVVLSNGTACRILNSHLRFLVALYVFQKRDHHSMRTLVGDNEHHDRTAVEKAMASRVGGKPRKHVPRSGPGGVPQPALRGPNDAPSVAPKQTEQEI